MLTCMHVQIEKQKQAHKEQMEEIMNMRKSVPAKPALESVEFLAKYRQAEYEMEARVKSLENMVRDSEKRSNKSLAKVEKLRRQVTINPGSRAARALERELKKNPQRRLANEKWRGRGRGIGRRTDRHRPGKTSDGLTVLYYSSRVREVRWL